MGIGAPSGPITAPHFDYCRAMAMRTASSTETRWSRLCAASAMASCTPLTVPLNPLPRDP